MPDPIQPVHATEGANDSDPAGFCPHCQYPINPGTCPECGADVPPHRLATSLRKIRRRRRIRQLATLLVIAAGLFGLYRFYHTNIWLRWLPTSALLWTDVTTSRATDELARRSAAGALTDEQTRQLASRCVTVATRIRSPRPAGDRFILGVDMRWTRALTGFGILNVPSPEVTIAGHDVRVRKVEEASPNDEYAYECVVAPPLAPGEYKVSGTAYVAFDPHTSTMMRSQNADVPLRIAFEHTVVVDNRPLEMHVPAVFNNRLRDAIHDNIELSVCGASPHVYVAYFWFSRINFPIVGRIELRLGGADTPFGTFDFSTTAPGLTNTYSNVFTLPKDVDPDGATIDVRFVPDIERAFIANYPRCFGGTIAWYGVPVGAAAPGNKSQDCSPGAQTTGQPPDAVERWTPPD